MFIAVRMPYSIFNVVLVFYSKYYEKDALVADPDYGTILSSLLGILHLVLFTIYLR